MATARQAQAWAHTSSVLATLANTTRDPKKRRKPFTPAEFDPTQSNPAKDLPLPGDISVLKRVL